MIYDDNYIREEWRCGWKVESEMKKVWTIQLDLVEQLREICEKHNLKWFPMWGTLLGAIRHKGFVPWDDDIDIVMPREDFDRFVAVAQDELTAPYFLQTTLTDQECFYMWASLRNSETTGNRKSCLHKKQNNGIAIDIMPLDGCENSPVLYRMTRFPVRIVSVLANTYVNEFNTGRVANLLRKLLRLTGFDYKKAYIWCEKQNRKFRLADYPLMAFRAHADPLTKVIQRDMWRKEDFDTVEWMPFEYIKIPVPCGYDRLLTQIYGNYMEFPPMDKREGKHDVVFEPDVPYKEYMKKRNA